MLKLFMLLFSLLLQSFAFAAITQPNATNNETQVVYSFHLSTPTPYQWYQVFIDTDLNANTGFSIGGIGAEYLIENDKLYRRGSGSGWSWTYIKTIPFVKTSQDFKWTVDRSLIGEIDPCLEKSNIVFRVGSSSGQSEISSVYNHIYSANASCGPTFSASDDLNYVYYQIQGTTPQQFYRVYIDTDQSTQTGFLTGKIGADYLIENQALYKYTGNQNTWSWSLVRGVEFTNNGTSVSWKVPRADLGDTQSCLTALNLVFQVESPGNLYTGPDYLQKLSQGTSCQAQKIAIPSYFGPRCNSAQPATCYWDQLRTGAPTVGLAIINPYNGPSNAMDPDYLKQVQANRAKGITTIGYVYTQYGARSASTIKKEIDLYYQWYGLDGIFFDETSNNCAQQSYYQDLHNYVKQKSPQATTVLNPGSQIPECYITAGDILINFESNYLDYLNWKPMGWETKYPSSRFWQLVYGAPQSMLSTLVQRTKAFHAGWIYITDDLLPNPWDTLPNASYLNEEIRLINLK